MDKQLVSLLS